MNQRIKLKKPNRTTDGFGGNTTSFVTYTVWAKVEEQDVNKTFENGTTVYGKRFTIQFRNGGVSKNLDPEWRIEYRSQDLEIMTFSLDDNRTMWTVVCEYAS